MSAHLLKYLLLLGIFIPGCPPFFDGTQDTPAIESFIEVSRLNATKEFDLVNCRNINLDIEITSTLTGTNNVSISLHHGAVLSSESGQKHPLQQIDENRFVAEGVRPGLYFFDYTIHATSELDNISFQGQQLEVRETIEIYDPESLPPVPLEVMNASCQDCKDGYILLMAENLPPLQWNTGDTARLLDSLGPGRYEFTMLTDGWPTCALSRSLDVGINAPLKNQETYHFTRCDPTVATPSYELQCDSFGMPGQHEGFIDFDLGKVQFAELALDAFIQFEFEFSNRGPDDWNTLFRLASATNVLAEGRILIPQNSVGFNHIPLRIPLLDFVSAGGFDIDLSLRIFMRDSLYLRSLSWSIFEQSSGALSIDQVGRNRNQIQVCTGDSVNVHSYYQISGGTTPYQFFWDLDDDGEFDDVRSKAAKIGADDPGFFKTRLMVIDATGNIAIDSINFQIEERPIYELYAVLDHRPTQDTIIYICQDSDAIILLPVPDSASITGPGLDGNVFRPADAGKGIHTLSVGKTSRCSQSAFLHIVVQPSFDPEWHFPDTLFCEDTLDLSTLVLGDSGGLWFKDQTILNHIDFPLANFRDSVINLTYGYGMGSCAQYSSKPIEVICEPTSSKQIAKLRFDVFPNPSTGAVVVSMAEEVALQHIVLFDLHGHKVIYPAARIKNQYHIDLSEHPPGIYLLQIIGPRSSSFGRKIVLIN